MKSFPGQKELSLFWAMFWNQKSSASRIELYQLITERKTSDCGLCFIIIYIFAQSYLS